MAYKSTDEEFIAAWKRCGGSPQRVSGALSIGIRAVYHRREAMEKRGVFLKSVPIDNRPGSAQWAQEGHAYQPRANEMLTDGYLIVFSDCHYWPGTVPLAHEALVKVCKQLKPKLVIANGDIFDGANISRHEPMGWQKLPTVIQELDTVKLRLWEIEKVTPNAARRYTIGNHCSRFDRRLATEVSQFEDVPGMRLQDHLKNWPQSYSVLINEDIDPVFVLHNIRGGMHAPFNNVKAAGCTVITGHLHSQKAEPYTTMLHDWEGIDAGCIADLDSGAFAYAMDRPRDWRSGFCAVRFDDEGKRFPVEFCRVQHYKGYSRAVFRSEVVVERREKVL